MDAPDLERYRKTRVETVGLPDRIVKSLLDKNIRTLGGILARSKKELRGLLNLSEEEVELLYLKARAQEELNEEWSPSSQPTYRVVEKKQYRTRDLNDVIETLARQLGSRKSVIEEHTRNAATVRARDIIMYLLREYAGMSYPAIGRLIDRDHTTVIHAHSKLKQRFEENPDLEKDLMPLIETVKSIKERRDKIESAIIPSILATVEIKKKNLFKQIPNRNIKILDLYREGLTLENIANVVNLTRERVRQIVINTVRQQAINESISKGIVMDSEALLEEEAKKRRAVQQAKRPQKPSKEEKKVRWSRYYLACRSCGTTTVHHVQKGYCETCLGMVRGKRRNEIMDQHQNKCDMCGISRGEAIRQYGRDFYITKSQRVLCKKDFLYLTAKKLVESRWKKL